MSTINRLLSRREKHSHSVLGKKEVMPHHSSPTSRLTPLVLPSTSSGDSSSIAASERLSRQQSASSSSSRNISLAFSHCKAKKSPRLQLARYEVECASANRICLLQPKQSTGPLNGLFVDEDKKTAPEKEEEKKIKTISQRLSSIGINSFKDEDIHYVLNAEYAKGDAEKAYELLAILKDSEEGIIQPYNPDVKLLGAVNRQGVTCYLDALLFAMFARLGSFEAMLYKNNDDSAKQRLVTLLRLWVNVLRAGKLITVDITKQIQLQLSNCGWKEAAKLCQQDASEAFTFITGTLALPLLTLKMDIFHTGREDAADDHKFINERLLELAIPEEKDGDHIITLEECLEMFFNNKIEVKRYLETLERRNTLGSVKSRLSIDSTKGRSTHIEVAEVEDGEPSSPLRKLSGPPPSSPAKLTRRRAPSIIQETYIDEKAAGVGEYPDEKSQNRRIRKEVMMPAWQFFSLIPWYTNSMPSNDAQVAAHFSSTRPILGICLKRYYMTNSGRAMKRTTHVDIPLEIGLPHFIQDDDMSEDGPAFGNFKMSLQSVVCHQGISTESGHYISLVRSPDSNLQGESRWMRFDDLASERVIDIDAESFLKESTNQTPYLLFYQVIPIEEKHPSYSQPQAINEPEPPPSYADSVGSKDSKTNLDPSRQSLEVSRRTSIDQPLPKDSQRGRSSLTVDQRSSELSSSPNTSNTSVTNISSGTNKASNDSSSRWSTAIKSVLNENGSNGGSNGPNSLTSTRRSSKAGVESKSRGTSRSDNRAEKRMSASLSRLAGRLSGSRDRLSAVMTNQTNGTIGGAVATSQGDSSILPGSLSLQTELALSAAPAPPVTAPTAGEGGGSQLMPPPTLLQQLQGSPKLMAPATNGTNRPTSSEKGRLRKEKGDIDAEATSANGVGAKHHHHHLTKAVGGEGKPDRECTVM